MRLIRSRLSNEPRRRSSSFLGVLLLAYAPPLIAQEAPGTPEGSASSPEHANARGLANEGLTAFAAGRYEEAVEKFEAAYQLVPAPGLLYNVAQAYRLNGDCVLAVARYRAFLSTGAGEKTRQLAERRIAELLPCDAEVGVQPQPSPMPVRLPSKPVLRLLPPRVLAQESRRADHAAQARSAASSSRASKLVYASVGYGGSLILLSVGAYFGVRAQNASERVSAASAREQTWSADLAAAERSGKRDQAVALATLTGGLVSLGVTTCLLAFDW